MTYLTNIFSFWGNNKHYTFSPVLQKISIWMFLKGAKGKTFLTNITFNKILLLWTRQSCYCIHSWLLQYYIPLSPWHCGRGSLPQQLAYSFWFPSISNLRKSMINSKKNYMAIEPLQTQEKAEAACIGGWKTKETYLLGHTLY